MMGSHRTVQSRLHDHAGPGGGRQRRRARTRVLGVTLGAACAMFVAVASASAQVPTVLTGAVAAVTTTGAEVNITVNPNGDDTYYAVQYGPAGGPLSSMTGYNDAGSGTTPIVETVGIPQLTPGTAYTYQATVFQNDTGMATTDPNTQNFTTTTVPTGPGTPIVPPQNPPTNGLFGFCSSDAQCLSDLNGDNAAQDGVAPITLPSNWATLTGAEQLFVGANLERVALGETPIPNLVDTYDAAVQTGIQNDADPALTGFETSIWAGAFPTPLGALYGWLDNDGPGGANLDCTTTNLGGCFGHRDNLLDDPGGTLGNPTEMDAGVGTDSNGSIGYAALFTANPNTPAANIVMTWASEQQFLAPPSLGGVTPRGPKPTLGQLALSPSSLTALRGRKAPAIVLDVQTDKKTGTVISYTDSQKAVSTFTIEQAVTGVVSHGRCVASSARRHTTAKRCTRDVTIGSFVHVDVAGHNRFRFLGRFDGHRLTPGAYVLSVSAVSATGRRGVAVVHDFVIVR